MRALPKFPIERGEEHLHTERGDKARDEVARELGVAEEGIGLLADGRERRRQGRVFLAFGFH